MGGVAGILAIIIALRGSLLSSAYAHEVVPALEPFVEGYIDSQDTRDAVLEKLDDGDSDLSLEDILAQDSSLRYDYAYECMSSPGFYESGTDPVFPCGSPGGRQRHIHDRCGGGGAVRHHNLCGCTGVVFPPILIFLVAIGNVGNLSFRLPNMEALDEVG
ncbi:MAG: hypothetical protein V8T45_08295, partial [Oscillospiraceae bacterium]